VASRKLTVAEKFYLDSHARTKSAEELAGELQLPLKVVKAHVSEAPPLPQTLVNRAKTARATSSPSKPKPKPRPTFFAEHSGTTAMTKEQAELDDAARQEPNEEFLSTVKNNIHVMDPSKPIR
jgi:hypothetical protein